MRSSRGVVVGISVALAAGLLGALAPATAAEGAVPIDVDGSPVTFTLGVGEEAVAEFVGVQGQRVIVQTIATNVTTYPSRTRDLEVDVVNVRTGGTLADVGGDYEDVFDGIGEAVTLRENGSYQLRISPAQNFAGDVTITLKSPMAFDLRVGGGTSVFDLQVGEEAVARFEGTKDQWVTVQTQASDVTRFPSNTRDLDVTVYNARTGRFVQEVGGDYEDVFQGVGQAVKLPVTGPYEIRISPEQYFAGGIALGLVPPQTDRIFPGGGPQTFPLGVGEQGITTFSGKMNELVTIRTLATNVVRYPATFREVEVYVTNTRTGRLVSNVGDDYEDVFDGIGKTVKLPATGEYSIRISPDQYFVGDIQVEMLSPLREEISTNGQPLTFTLGVGEEGVAEFSASKGQRVTIEASISSGSRYPSSYSNLNVYLVNSRTGRTVSDVGDDYIDVLEGTARTLQIREAGRYHLRVSPTQYFSGDVTLSVRALS